MDFAWSVVSFVVAVGVLVTVHEFGHFWVARRLGVKVLRFSIGFGRSLWSVRAGRDRTEYVLAAVPLGGYVKMLDESEGPVAPEERHRAFNRQRLPVRVAVVAAGPVFNFLFAIVAYSAMFMIGVTGLRPLVAGVAPGSIAAAAGIAPGQQIVQVAGRDTPTWESVVQTFVGAALAGGSVEIAVDDGSGVTERHRIDVRSIKLDELTRGHFFSSLGITPRRPSLPAVIGSVEPGGRAAAAGFEAGDRVVEADGKPIPDWSAWVEYVRARPEVVIRTVVERDGARLELDVRPARMKEGDGAVGHIGALVAAPEHVLDSFYARERYGPLDAFSRAVAKTRDLTLLTLRFMWKMLLRQVSVSNLSGPISIAQYAGLSAQIGLAQYLGFLGIVSISLGILNLLPVPVLDGGHLLYYLIESLRGRPLSEEAQFMGQRVGIAMLVGLMGLAFYNDLARLFG